MIKNNRREFLKEAIKDFFSIVGALGGAYVGLNSTAQAYSLPQEYWDDKERLSPNGSGGLTNIGDKAIIGENIGLLEDYAALKEGKYNIQDGRIIINGEVGYKDLEKFAKELDRNNDGYIGTKELRNALDDLIKSIYNNK